MSKTGPLRQAFGWVALVAVIAAGILVWNNRLAIADDYRLWNYTPPADIAALGQQIGFTALGQRYFYASHPVIEGKTTFNTDCQAHEAGQAVLGCYTRDSIYLYDVTDSRLDGVKEVTAAHETLHAAYARLSNGERANVDAMIERQYATLQADPAFAQRFSVYDSLSQADKLNELHSIFGTEVASLSSELETYYGKYFKDRGAVARYYVAYQGPFDTLKTQQSALQAQIETLKKEIASAKTAYASDRSALDSDIQTFNQSASSGGYPSQSQYASDRSALEARSNALNAEADAINAKIDQYNAAIKQYNALSIQTEDLNNSLDSNAVQSAPTV